MKRTVVIGASPNRERYSYEATVRLAAAGEEVFPIGIRKGQIGDLEIITDRPIIDNVDTITLYVGPQHQSAWSDYLFELHPRRVIFNPGTVNDALIAKLEAAGIHTEVACTLVLLSTRSYHSNETQR